MTTEREEREERERSFSEAEERRDRSRRERDERRERRRKEQEQWDSRRPILAARAKDLIQLWKLPQWAPRELTVRLFSEVVRMLRYKEGDPSDGVGYVINIVEARRTTEERIDLIRKLLSDRDMEGVWQRLERRSSGYRAKPPLHRRQRRDDLKDRYPPLHYSDELFVSCVNVIEQWQADPKLSRAEYRDLHVQIAKRTGDLLGLLQSQLPLYAHLLNETELTDQTDDEFDSRFLPSPFFTQEAAMLGELLSRLRDNALYLSSSGYGISQPNAPDAHIRFVATWLVEHHFMPCYGQPLHDIAATVTNVVLGSSIDQDHIRAWMRTRKTAVEKPRVRSKKSPSKR